MTPSKPKITLSFEELHAPAVDERLGKQAAVESAISSSQRAASTPSRLPIPSDQDVSLWRNTFFNLFVFGLLGGLLAWGSGELVEYFNPDQKAEAQRLEQSMLDLRYVAESGRVHDPGRMNHDLALLKAEGQGNPWFEIDIDTKLTEQQKEARRTELAQRAQLKRGIADGAYYAACGMMIAISLGMAESVASRNPHGAIVYGGVGAVLGLLGGITYALAANPLYHLLGGGQSVGKTSLGTEVLARAAGWAILGIFLSAAPGVVLRNRRKLFYGLIGGVLGGAIGGAMIDPISRYTSSPMIGHLIVIVSIGVITGIATALVENALKQGWLKVVQGLIAGKQFIVYRNPTFIGSSPSCEIYLFRDVKVGPRHAALYISPDGYDIEDLGTGSRTMVNGRPIRRARLRNGDRLQIGSTGFTFNERAKKT